jgi:hypothetical protein
MEKKNWTTEQREEYRTWFGYNNEQIDRIEADRKRHELVDHMKELHGTKMIAECIEAENCGFNKILCGYGVSKARVALGKLFEEHLKNF